MNLVYADNNATTPIAPEVVEAMAPFWTSQYFNPSSMYSAAQSVATVLDQSRRTIAEALGIQHPDELLFTSGATESNNAAIRGVARANFARNHIITTAVEHPAVLEVCREMQRRGYDVTWLPVDRQGRLNVLDFVRALRPDTLLVSVMHANNETGVVFDVAELARITKETHPSIVFHTDATQTLGKLPMDLSGEYSNVDLLSFSGHKLHAAKGVGGVFVRRGTPMRPFLIGGHQEGGRRAGTENVAAIAGMARAVELATKDIEGEIRRMQDMTRLLEEEMARQIPYMEINGKMARRLPNTSNLAFHYIEGEGILQQLDAQGICASSGSACTSGSLEPSHVLTAMDVPFTARHGSVRFSFGRYNTMGDVTRIVQALPGIVDALRRMSPYWDYAANRPRQDVRLVK